MTRNIRRRPYVHGTVVVRGSNLPRFDTCVAESVQYPRLARLRTCATAGGPRLGG